MAPRIWALAVLAFLAAAWPASAATVTRPFPSDPFDQPFGPGTAVFTAAPGETNRAGSTPRASR